MKKPSSSSFRRARLSPVLALAMSLLVTGSAFADQFYFSRSRTGAGAEDGATGLFLWNDATGAQSQVGGDGVYLRHVPDGPMQVDGIALNSGVLYGFALDDTANGSLLPFPAVVTNVCTPSIQSRLVTIDTSTAVFSYVASSSWLAGRHFTGAGFDSQGRLWALDCTSGEVTQIDLATGNTMGSPIATGLAGQSASDLDFAANGLGIIGYSGLQFRVFNPNTSSVADVPITAVNGTGPNAFDSGLVPPYGVSGVAFTTDVAARNGSPAAQSCRLNIFEGRGLDELGHANDPFAANPLIAFRELLQYNPPSPPWNAGSGDAARLGGPALPDCFYDWGDAPASYGTLLANNGPRHLVTATSPYLGSGLPDFEVDGVPNAAANGDDANGDDEDGVLIPTLEAGATVQLQVTVGGVSATTRLQAWIDWGRDGSFAQAGDQVLTDAVVAPGGNTFNVTVPVDALAGSSYARFRIANVPGLTSQGTATEGEVEDYQVQITSPLPGEFFPTCPINQQPPPTTFSIQQRWTTPDVAGQRTLAYQTPVVGDLFGNGQPVAVVASENGFQSGGLAARQAKDLHIVNGSTGAILNTIVTPLFNWSGHAVVAIADVDGDGQGEIILKASQSGGVPAAQRGRLIAYRNDGTQMWVSDERYDYAETNGRGGMSLNFADFNGDGIPEVYVGDQIFNARTGVRLAASASASSAGCPHRSDAGVGCFYGQTTAADMDGDGLLELVAGNVVYKVTIANPSGAAGNSLSVWQQAAAAAGVGDGFTAVADIDLDGDPDVVVVRTVNATSTGATRIYAWDGQTSTVLGMLANIGTVGGAPLLGDIDGDGSPEIVAVTSLSLRAFKYQGGTFVSKWTLSTGDGSGETSLSMFDFNNDGSRELVYRDQDEIRIINGSGATATDLASFACTSGTATEMPVIAALDSSREARILVTCGSASIDTGLIRGTLRAFETASFPWANTRPVWNQQAYFVTHVENDLTIPSEQFPHWTSFSDGAQACSPGVNRPLNAFQQQVTDLDRSTGCPVLCPLPANVIVDKTASSNVATPGGTITYTVIVTNTGPGNSPDTLVQDPFPAGLTSAQWTCAASGGATCPNATSGGPVAPPNMLNETVTLPVNGILTYTIAATVAAAPPPQITNTASVTGPVILCVPDGTAPPCEDEFIVRQAVADLAITKVSAPNPYVPGDLVTYTIIVSNIGPDDAPGALVADTFPSQLSAVSWTCTANTGGTTACGAPSGMGNINTTVNLPSGGSVTFLVTATVDSSAIGPLSNTATVTPPAGIPDPVPGNNSAIDVNNADRVADLRVSKASTPNPFVPGEPLTYTVVVTNGGPSDVIGAPVNDTLPAAFSAFTWSCEPAGACAPSSGTGNINTLVDLPAGGTITFTSTGTVPPGFSTTAINTASITPPLDTRDPVPGNNTTTTPNPPNIIADLAIAKSQSPTQYTAGGPMTYTLVVQNFGPSDAANARVQDLLPGPLTGVQWTCVTTDAGASCGTPSGISVVDALVTLPVNTAATFTVTGTVVSSATGILSNTATVTPPSTVTDPNPGNNESTVNTDGAPLADLAVVKTASPNPYVPGGPLTFTIVARNDGPSDVLNARVQDLFPPAFSGFTWTCAPTIGAAVCGAASGTTLIDVPVSLAAGAAVTFTVTGVVPPDTTEPQTNTATITPPIGVTDPIPANNTSAVTLGPGPVANLRVSKTSTPNPYVPGTPITYTVVVANDGPSVLFGGRVRDLVPAVLQNITWTCSAIGGTCPAPAGFGNVDTLVDITPGGTVSFVITGDVPAETRGVLTNVATVVPPPGLVDPTPTDNTAINNNPVVPPGGPADLQITQEAPSVAPPNGLLTFRLVTRNLGSNTALNPYITGMIPPGTTFVSVTPGAGGTCNVPGNPPAPDPATGYPIAGAAAVEPLRCTWPGLMKPGESHVMEFTVRVAPTTPTGQILWSCWWTWSETEDPYHANNVVDAYLFVHDGVSPVGDLALQGATLTEGVIGSERPVRVGEAVPIRFWATNHGPATTRGQYALILDTVNTVEIVSVKAPQGWISPSGPSSAVWDTGPVQPGQTVAVDLTVRVRTPSAVKLLAQRISGAPGDPNATNEHAEIVLDGYGPAGTAGRWVAVGNVDGAGAGEIVTGAGQGETPQVRVFNGNGSDTNTRFFAYERPFLGGVRIASCDMDGDGTAEVITAPGMGRAPTIRVLGITGGVVTELVAFDAFEADFLGGAYIACADLDADGIAELVIGAGPGRAPEVKVYNVGLSIISERSTFLAYESTFRGGVRVAAGAYPGRAGWLGAFAIATTPGPGRPVDLRLWEETGAPVAQVGISSTKNGILPTLGDANGDGQLDLVVAPDDGRPELVRIFDVDTGSVIGEVPGGGAAFPVGVRIALGVLTGGPGASEIVVGNGPGGHPRVRVVFWPPAGPVQRLEILPLEIP